MPKNDPNNFQSLIHQIVAEGMQRSKLDMDVIEFATELLGVELWPTQRAILKALYNLPFERGQWRSLFKGTPEEVEKKCARFDHHPDDWWDERAILEQWAIEGKTTWVEGQPYSELVLECGMRGSKTSMVSIPVTYEFFRLMQHDDPASTFGLLSGSLICFLVLATSESQAQDTLFAAIKGRIENSPYFQGLMATQQIVVNNLDIYVPGKNLKMFAGHSRSAGLVGRTLMVFAIDEGNRFGIEAAGGATGIDMYSNVGKGVTTLSRFGSKKIVISSAWCEGDLTDTLYQVAQDGGDHILAFRLATWDMNPEFAKLKEEHPFIQQEYKTRGVEAQRDYAGLRPGVDEQFFNKQSVAKVMKGKEKVSFTPRKDGRTVTGADGTKRTYAAVDIHIPRDIVIPAGMFSYGHCDPGLKKDSFGFVAGNPFLDRNTGLLSVDITTIVEWQPIDKGQKNIWMVDYENVEEQLLKVAEPLLLKRLTFDHWNCYKVGSLIATPTGLRPVESLLVGDQVVGLTGTLNRVVARQLVSSQPVVRVKTKFGYEAVVTPHHPFWVPNRGWKKAGELAPGDRIALDEGLSWVGEYHDPLKSLVYGYLVAEGDWSDEANSVRFSNTEPEVQHDFASAFEAVFGFTPTADSKTVRCGWDEVRAEVQANVMTGAHNKHVPEFVMFGTAHTIGAFLAGLYEGDGNVRLNKKVLSVELNTVSQRLAREVQLLLLRLGIKSSRKYFTNKWFKGKQCPFYRITIYGQNIKTFLMNVGFRSNRKKLLLERAVRLLPESRRSRSQDPYSAVVSVESEVADIAHLEVDGDHSYIGEGLVGHNSAMMIQKLYSKGVSTYEFKSSFSQTVQREIYTVLREWINAERVRLPDPSTSPAVAKLYKELCELRVQNGRRIDHPKPKGCFTGDTKVSLLDGRERTFEELVEEFGDGTPFHVYAVDPATQDMKVGVAYNPRLTMKNAEIVAVTLDNGEVIRCTPDHRFMLRDGSWCEARDLGPGTSLMPLYRKVPTARTHGMKGYEMYLNPSDQKYRFTHRMVGEFKYGTAYTTGMQHGLILHHEKGKRNNDPTYLLLMDKVAHGLMHAEDIKRRRSDPRWVDGVASTFPLYLVINHKVASVEPAGFADVYDISVNEWENFALTSGVFVHNSKDLSDCLACVVWHISQEERRFKFMEIGDKKFRTMGQIHSARAIDELFHDGKALAERNDRMLRNEGPVQGTQRRTIVTQKDW